MILSIILCTHNPGEDYLHRTLEALRLQTLSMDEWELLLIDNASKVPLSGRFDLSWHPKGRHIREEELGLTAARLRGIREATGEILVFVDDDNVLDADYLEQAWALGKEYPFIGAWGGSVSPQFAVPLPGWIDGEAWRLTIVAVQEDIWSNLRERFDTVPVGAGMCIRKSVGLRFIEWNRINKNCKALGRTGTAMSGYEDVDLAHCALDLGLGTGKFRRLHLTHLIPAARLTLDYFIRHAEGDAASLMIFRATRGLPLKESGESSWMTSLKWFLHCLRRGVPKERRQLWKADQRGRRRGLALAKEYLKNKQ